jgi:D-glucosaminate-6-phosphate ammonia-lyase
LAIQTSQAAGVLSWLGVTPVLNAAGPVTRLGGIPLDRRVIDAMSEVSTSCLRMEELQQLAGDAMARWTGTEAALITCGAGAALALAVAACLTGYDVSAANQLPVIRSERSQVVMLRAQRYPYDHLVQLTGATITEVGYAESTHLYEVIDALTPASAAFLYYTGQPSEAPSLAEITAACHARSVPVIVDAAIEDTPPVLDHRWAEAGADLIVFSGGKTIGGPQASGVLCGQRDLVDAASLQTLDMDVRPQTWVRHDLLERQLVAGPPHHGLGRAMKAGKEEIAGLIAAARLFMARDHAAYIVALTARMSSLIARVGDHRGVRADVSAYDYAPRGRLHVDPPDAGFDAWALLAALQRGTPRLHLNEAAAWKGTALIDLRGVDPSQDDAVADLISAALRGLAAGR